VSGVGGKDHVRNNVLVTNGTCSYAAFFPAFNFAHLARWNAAIFLRAAADMVRLKGTNPVVFASDIGCDSLRAFAHLARCACAILRREACDIIRVGWFAC
jgi:hypothetical protein